MPASQAWLDRLEAANRNRAARVASGEAAVKKFRTRFAFMSWGLSTQNAVSPQSAALAQKIMNSLVEGRSLEAAGQPDTMPDATWDSFREELAVGESWAQRHIAAWRQMQEYAAQSGAPAGPGGIALVTGPGAVTEPPSNLGRNLIIASGVAGALGAGYLIIRKLRKKGGR
jgi:hypothetical protein